MGVEGNSRYTTGADDINALISNGKPVIFQDPGFSVERFERIGRVLKSTLEFLKRPDLHEPLQYVLNELITNADKANSKRLFFSENNLNIHKSRDYQEGMSGFSNLDDDDQMRLKARLGENGFFTRVSFHLEDHDFKISVINNSLPTEDELTHVHSRIETLENMNDIAEAYTFLYDESEGAGFGIITTILSLRSLGAHDSPYRFAIRKETGEALQETKIPLNALSEDHIEGISEEISKEIKMIPKLPENVIEIQRMLSNPDRPLSDVAAKIARDPSLTADLLRIVNSAQYMLPQKMTNIESATSLLGTNALKNLMYMYGARGVLEKRYKELRDLWRHAYRCAFYSREIARRYGFSNEADDLYVIGILLDIGRIVLIALHADLVEKLSVHCDNNGIPGDYIETLVLGVGHAKTGAMIAERWGLPEKRIGPIEYHHQPYLAPEKCRNNAYVVHLADLIATGYDESGIDFKTLPRRTLDFFEFETEEAFNVLVATLSEKLAQTELGF